MTAYAGFCGPSYTSQSLVANAEKCVNWYVEKLRSENARVRTALYPTPGLNPFAMTNQVGGRALFEENDRLFGVIGGKLVEVAENGDVTYVNDVLVDDKPATATTSGDAGHELFLTSGTKGYLYDLTSGAFSNPVNNVTFAGYLDTFFVALDNITSTLKISESLDGGTWDPTQIQQRSDASDPWRSMLIVEPEIWLFGSKTTGVWFNKGTSPFPLAPRTGLVIRQGTAAAFSPANVDGTPMWLGTGKDGDYVVYAAEGYNAVPVSDEGMQWAISQYRRVDDAVGFAYKQQGHPFYVLNFPSAKATWVYDRLTFSWHERGTWDAAANSYDAWHASCHAFAFGKNLMADRVTGRIYEADIEYGFDAGGAPLRRWRRGPGMRNEHRRIFINNWQLDVESGLGLAIGQGSDPQVMFRNSWNGGKTYGNERWKSAGKQGEYGRRVIWNRVGSGPHFVPDIVVTDPTPWRVLGAEYNVPLHEAA